MAGNGEWRPNGRPKSVMVLNFEADLDNIFNLGPQAELELSVEAKKHEVKLHERQLEDLDAKLRQATEQLKRLESKHKRMKSGQLLTTNPPRRPAPDNQYSNNNSSDSEERGFSDS